MPPETGIFGRRNRCEKFYFPEPLPKRIDEATPADVKARARERIKQLKENIAAWKKSIGNAEVELAEWQAFAATEKR